MIAIAISLLFGITAFMAFFVIFSSVGKGALKAQAIMTELAELDGKAATGRVNPSRASQKARSSEPLQPLFAAA